MQAGQHQRSLEVLAGQGQAAGKLGVPGAHGRAEQVVRLGGVQARVVQALTHWHRPVLAAHWQSMAARRLGHGAANRTGEQNQDFRLCQEKQKIPNYTKRNRAPAIEAGP